ncbi:MAG: hypothetical protein KDA57_16970 [Planctomycetales bacterium]|nr:hypothetical protein [Planctomycetales bacterium]
MAFCRQTPNKLARQLPGLQPVLAALLVLSIFAGQDAPLRGQTAAESLDETAIAELHVGTTDEACDVCSPEAAQFDQWQTLVDEDSRMYWDADPLQRGGRKPFDWVSHFGFRHSSTHGRHVGRGIPLEGTSVRNRPFHVDWFVGPLIGDSLIDSRVTQQNVLMGGARIGWDFDYYWGIEWRYARADPGVQYATPLNEPGDMRYSLSDIDLIYYPWGDSKVRPYGLLGIGAAQIDFLDDAGVTHDATLATMPMGVGVQFHQWPWLMWRMEVLDNLSFGDNGLSTLHNVSITAGMEIRLGARPASYWPWRSSRKIW